MLKSSQKQLWSHLAGRKAFREHLANVMSVSIEKWRISCQYRPKKQSIKAPANPQIFSDRRTIFRIASLLRKVTTPEFSQKSDSRRSDFKFGTRYFSQKANSIVTHFHRFISSFVIVNINWIISAVEEFKYWIYINYPHHSTQET